MQDEQDYDPDKEAAPEFDPYEPLFLQLDAPQETAATSALRVLRSMLKENGKTITQYRLSKQSDGKKVAALQAELTEEKRRADEEKRRAEEFNTAGAYIDAELTKSRARVAELEGQPPKEEGLSAEQEQMFNEYCDRLTNENWNLRHCLEFCWPCELKRRCLAGTWGALASLPCLFWLKPKAGVSLPYFLAWLACSSLPLSLSLGGVFAVWHWRKFKVRKNWSSLIENDLARAAANKWNAFLDRFRLRPV